MAHPMLSSAPPDDVADRAPVAPAPTATDPAMLSTSLKDGPPDENDVPRCVKPPGKLRVEAAAICSAHWQTSRPDRAAGTEGAVGVDELPAAWSWTSMTQLRKISSRLLVLWLNASATQALCVPAPLPSATVATRV